jgi:hypothetical protein
MKNNRGFSALVLVLIIGISSLIISKGATWLGLRELDMSRNNSIGKQTAYVAEACLEDALLKFRIDRNFSANGRNIQLGDCSCVYSTTSNGNEKLINGVGTCQNFTVDLKMTLNTEEGININSWEYE